MVVIYLIINEYGYKLDNFSNYILEDTKFLPIS